MEPTDNGLDLGLMEAEDISASSESADDKEKATDTEVSTPKVEKVEPKLVPEEDLNKMKSSFQRREAQMARQIAETQRQAQQMQDYLWQLQASQLPPEQRQLAQYERQVAQEAQRIQEAQQMQASQATALEPVFKEIVIRDFMDEYRGAGVTRQMLERFQDPNDMEAFCKLQREMHRDRQAKARVGKDAVARSTGTATGSKDWSKRSARDLLAEFF